LDKNNNKFYIIQLLEHDTNNELVLFTRWGRVGVPGNHEEKNVDTNSGPRLFMKKYRDKMKHGYQEIFIDYEAEVKQESPKKDINNINNMSSGKKKFQNTLNPDVMELISLIYNKKMISDNLHEIGYDSQKMPLGKLSPVTLTTGLNILKEIESELKNKYPNKENLKKYSSEFYTQIPHNFGFQKMANFIIDTIEKVKEKINMISALSDMKITLKILENVDKESTEEYENEEEKQIHDYYNQLKCDIRSISPTEEIYSILNKYLTAKVNKSEDYYGYRNRISLLKAYELNRHGEKEKFKDDLKELNREYPHLKFGREDTTFVIHGTIPIFLKKISNELFLFPIKVDLPAYPPVYIHDESVKTNVSFSFQFKSQTITEFLNTFNTNEFNLENEKFPLLCFFRAINIYFNNRYTKKPTIDESITYDIIYFDPLYQFPNYKPDSEHLFDRPLPDYLFKNHKFQTKRVQKKEQWEDIQHHRRIISDDSFNNDYNTFMREIEKRDKLLSDLSEKIENIAQNKSYKNLLKEQKELIDSFEKTIEEAASTFRSLGKTRAKINNTQKNLECLEKEIQARKHALKTQDEECIKKNKNSENKPTVSFPQEQDWDNILKGVEESIAFYGYNLELNNQENEDDSS